MSLNKYVFDYGLVLKEARTRNLDNLFEEGITEIASSFDRGGSRKCPGDLTKRCGNKITKVAIKEDVPQEEIGSSLNLRSISGMKL